MALSTSALYAGNASVSAGNTTVTFNNASLQSNDVQPGWYFFGPGGIGIVDSVTGQNELELVNGWMGSTMSNDDYYLIPPTEGVLVALAARQAFQLLLSGNVEALAGLTGAANKLGYFTGEGSMAVTDLTSKARDLLANSDVTSMLATLGIARHGQITVDSSGNVGIGTDNPSTRLDVLSDGFAEQGRFLRDSSDAGQGGSILIGNLDQVWTLLGTANSFSIREGTTTERFKIDSGGNVGIGTDDPQRNVHVSGSGFVAVRIESGGSSYWEMGVTGAGNFGSNSFFFRPESDSDAAWGTRNAAGDAIFAVDTGTGNVSVGNHAASEKLDVDGNVIADDYLTHSRVADIASGERALDKLANIAEWRKPDGSIDYAKHHAYRACKRRVVDEEGNKTGAEETVHALSMETRVAELEKMVWELAQALAAK